MAQHPRARRLSRLDRRDGPPMANKPTSPPIPPPPLAFPVVFRGDKGPGAAFEDAVAELLSDQALLGDSGGCPRRKQVVELVGLAARSRIDAAFAETSGAVAAALHVREPGVAALCDVATRLGTMLAQALTFRYDALREELFRTEQQWSRLLLEPGTPVAGRRDILDRPMFGGPLEELIASGTTAQLEAPRLELPAFAGNALAAHLQDTLALLRNHLPLYAQHECVLYDAASALQARLGRLAAQGGDGGELHRRLATAFFLVRYIAGTLLAATVHPRYLECTRVLGTHVATVLLLLAPVDWRPV